MTCDYAPAELRLEVRDDGTGGAAANDGLGHGLIGIGERVKVYGGDMSAFAAAPEASCSARPSRWTRR